MTSMEKKDEESKEIKNYSSPSSSNPSLQPQLLWWQTKGWLFRPIILLVSLYSAVWIRLQAVRTYGKVIHEFDPWFNYRSTKYLVDNGWEKFSNWYDHESWYPIGRPVGHTIYPGLMVTAAKIYEFGQKFQYYWSLNDVCVFIPAIFSLVTVLAVYGLCFEVTNGSWTASTVSAAIMAIMPAHLMRSVAGGFDNESVAVAAIVVTFYLWVRSLRSPYMSWFFGSLCGISYVYLVSAWGAYIFVLNMIGVHVGILSVLMGRFSMRLHLAYSTFYIIGTYGALQFPTVGLQPLQSMEQLGPMVVFFILQIFALSDFLSKLMSSPSSKKTRWQAQMDRLKVLALFGVVAAVFVQMYVPSTFFGPLSARVRGLFVRHTKTGNPLVDSVAEHQQTPGRVYWLYFHWTFYMTPIGFYLTWAAVKKVLPSKKLNDQIYVDQAVFLLAFIGIAYYFSARMIRLVLLLSPAAAIAAGIVVDQGWIWAINRSFLDERPLYLELSKRKKKENEKDIERRKNITIKLTNYLKTKFKNKKQQVPTEAQVDIAVRRERQREESEGDPWALMYKEWDDNITMQRYTSYFILFFCWFGAVSFIQHSVAMSHHLSEPQIIVRIPDEAAGHGKYQIADDFREAYW
jgi:asparagine N-glycosylation enzyme membrane subunit Stt3